MRVPTKTNTDPLLTANLRVLETDNAYLEATADDNPVHAALEPVRTAPAGRFLSPSD